jgi:1-phosphofructokinase family hexose kinase
VITVAGLTPSLDLTYTVDALRPGQIHRVPEAVRYAGGKALNMARAAVTAGAHCRVVALLGGVTGHALAEMLAGEGVSAVVVDSPAETRVCVSIAANDTGQLTEVYQDAAPIPPEVIAAFAAAVGPQLEAGGWLSISGRAPGGTPDSIADLVRLGRGRGAAVAVDTHGEALGPALAAGPTLVKVNRQEAAGVLALPVDTDLLVLARGVRDRSGAVVVLTDGTAGSLAVDGGRALRVTGPDVVGRYPVGSGDSFLGGLLAALERGEALGDALRSATGCAMANALVPGQGHFDPETMWELAGQVEVRRL